MNTTSELVSRHVMCNVTALIAALSAGGPYGERPEASDAHNQLLEQAAALSQPIGDREVYEHWVVTQWLGEKLIAVGEKVDLSFGGLTVWARTTTGQAIYMDGCVEIILKDL